MKMLALQPILTSIENFMEMTMHLVQHWSPIENRLLLRESLSLVRPGLATRERHPERQQKKLIT